MPTQHDSQENNVLAEKAKLAATIDSETLTVHESAPRIEGEDEQVKQSQDRNKLNITENKSTALRKLQERARSQQQKQKARKLKATRNAPKITTAAELSDSEEEDMPKDEPTLKLKHEQTDNELPPRCDTLQSENRELWRGQRNKPKQGIS